jgi:ribosome-binding ATPase YchF (GTP1/OBG family)
VKMTAQAKKTPPERLLAQQLSGLGITEEDIKSATRAHGIEEHGFATSLRKVSKPIVIAANKADLPGSDEHIRNLKEATPCSAESELALREADRQGLIKYSPGSESFDVKGLLSEKQEQALGFIKTSVLEKYGSTGVQLCLNRLVFEKLNMIVVYPVANITKLASNKGNVLPDAYLIPNGTTLKELAFKIHTQFGENFIGGLDINRKKIGADYRLKDGDVVEIMFRT